MHIYITYYFIADINIHDSIPISCHFSSFYSCALPLIVCSRIVHGLIFYFSVKCNFRVNTCDFSHSTSLYVFLQVRFLFVKVLRGVFRGKTTVNVAYDVEEICLFKLSAYRATEMNKIYYCLKHIQVFLLARGIEQELLPCNL